MNLDDWNWGDPASPWTWVLKRLTLHSIEVMWFHLDHYSDDRRLILNHHELSLSIVCTVRLIPFRSASRLPLGFLQLAHRSLTSEHSLVAHAVPYSNLDDYLLDKSAKTVGYYLPKNLDRRASRCSGACTAGLFIYNPNIFLESFSKYRYKTTWPYT